MRVTVTHGKSKQEAKDALDRSLDCVFAGIKPGVINFVDQQKRWSGDTLEFALTVTSGFLRTPLRGFAIVTDRDVTLDIDLGLLGKLIPEQTARTHLERQIKGLLT